ncbi:hypothetical protein [Nostoc sp. UHCC 0870]|uniref:hypothetical protein n=1 Tax=Nostoc sp. UHCC 0870 TaxID=2914041 RepID=UPI001EE0961C|nr:hypothetical protein [Nostoc sp. UHCC 0870]UKP00520.1 hypothetical protein L6494_12790 [Nostoc sp. UHCC 0870]
MIDVNALAQAVTAILTPALPILVKVGDGALGKIGSDISDKVKTLWVKLHPRLQAKPSAQDAIAEVVNNPDDEDAKAYLRLQIKKLLTEDTEFAAEIAKAFSTTPTATATVVQQDGGIYVGGNASFGGDVAGRDLSKGDK